MRWARISRREGASTHAMVTIVSWPELVRQTIYATMCGYVGPTSEILDTSEPASRDVCDNCVNVALGLINKSTAGSPRTSDAPCCHICGIQVGNRYRALEGHLRNVHGDEALVTHLELQGNG